MLEGLLAVVLLLVGLCAWVVLRPAAGGSQQAGGAFSAIGDEFATLEEVQAALRRAGLESSSLVVGVDFTKSNEWNGARSCGGRCLHVAPSPYAHALRVLAATLAPFDDDGLIPAYGFGDMTTHDQALFSFRRGDEPCAGLDDVLARYSQIAARAELSGPTSFAPLIDHAAALARAGGFTILLILADGQVSDEATTAAAIVRASQTAPLAIVVVGIGDGPWDTMRAFDDRLPARRFDNFQFVAFNELRVSGEGEADLDVALAKHALMEVPQQYGAVKSLGLLSTAGGAERSGVHVLHPPDGGGGSPPLKGKGKGGVRKRPTAQPE